MIDSVDCSIRSTVGYPQYACMIIADIQGLKRQQRYIDEQRQLIKADIEELEEEAKTIPDAQHWLDMINREWG